jgi:hypothetical protein
MQRVVFRRLAAASLVAAASAAASSCRTHVDDASAPLPQSIDLIVRNDGFLDANIYTTFLNGARGARLGTVTGHSAARLSVRMSDLNPGNILVLRVHGIGATGDWLSQAVVVDPPDYAELTLIADANSRYEFSNLYPRVRRTAALPIH